jgi:DNA recombination protein RmuC
MSVIIYVVNIISLIGVLWLVKSMLQNRLHDQYTAIKDIQNSVKTIEQRKDDWLQFTQAQQQQFQQQREQFDAYRIHSLKSQQESLSLSMKDVRQQIVTTLNQHTQQVNERIALLTKTTENRLKEISKEVDKQLSVGFEKTTATFTDILKRLTIIDQAQKKITELSHNVVNLQEVLTDKRSRGAFGEVQLANLIKNMLPPKHYSFQHTLSNNKRVDCLLFLPDPTGNIAIDAKFPLENYRKIQQYKDDEQQRKKAESLFKDDIKKHISDIANKYIIPNETANGAILFLPAEAIFADIHAYHPDLVEYAQHKCVWLVSPTTMMAIITTAKAVLKDEATRQQVHLIQKHLVALSKDFSRFQKRMDNLAKHIDQAQEDVSLVHKSSQKISSRFSKIEQVELQNEAEEENLKSTASTAIELSQEA